MKSTVWILLDLVLATILAVLGNVVASYIQEKFSLTDPARIGFVIAVFVICFGLLLWITLKRSNTGAGENSTNRVEIEVKQQLGDIQKGGAVTGVEAEEIASPVSMHVEQKAKKASGELIGVQIGTLGGSGNENEKRKL